MYHFQQTSGSDVQLAGSDINLYASVSDSAFVKIATGTNASTWQCTDSQGFAYCLTSSRDTAVKTDGSVSGTTYQAGIPLGTMATFSPIQLIVAGVSTNESTIYVSQQNAFTTFTIGVLPSSGFTEPIASPGSRITHLAYYFGKLFWWKDQSFGYATFTNQNDWQLTIVSNQIGTLDNSDAFWNSSGFDSGSKFTGIAQANAGTTPGGIYFRGQDGHLYVYDGYYLTRLSRSITPDVVSANKQKSNSWTQSSQIDFQAGTIVPTGSLSTTISPGDVVPSSFTGTDSTSAGQWNAGTASNFAVGVSSLSLLTNNSGNINDPDFETTLATDWTSSGYSEVASQSMACTVTPASGSQFLSSGTGKKPVSPTMHFIITDVSGNVLNDDAFACTSSCAGWASRTTSVPAALGKRVFFKLKTDFTDATGVATAITKSSYLYGGSNTYSYRCDQFSGLCAGGGTCGLAAFDNIQNGSSTITSGNFTSRTFDTGFTSSTAQIQASWTPNTVVPYFELQHSINSGGPFLSVLTSTGTSAAVNRYIRYISSMSISSSDNANTAITSVSLISASSGTFYSQVHNAPNLTSWSIFGANYQGTNSFYIRSSTDSFTILSSTPAWSSIVPGSFIAISTGTYFQFKDDISISISGIGSLPVLNDTTFNWFEGSAGDKAYIAYFQDAIWFSISDSSISSTNNRIFYWDILNGSWSIFDIKSNGFSVENNRLYFGDPLSGAVYIFGNTTTDNGSLINSYWRSKAFLGKDPFVQNEFIQSDFILGQSPTTLSYIYTLDSKTSNEFDISSLDSSSSLIQRNFLLPKGRIGKFYDFQIGDNSSAPSWRLMGHRVMYNGLNWKTVLQ